MIHFHSLENGLSNDRELAFYRIAGNTIVSDYKFPGLEPYLTEKPQVPEDRDGTLPTVNFGDFSSAEIIHHGPGWIGNKNREVVHQQSDLASLITISGIGQFMISKGGKHIWQVEQSPASTAELLLDAFLGPALILALAFRGVWCLHASAILIGEKAVAFLGESGRGKSTLAWYLGKSPAMNGQQIGDDILPVAIAGQQVVAYPHFPQRKLKADEQPVHFVGEEVQLASTYILRQVDEPSIEAKIDPISPQAASLAFLRHTVGARLFDRVILTEHLKFCTRLAEVCPAQGLTYAHNFQLKPVQVLLLKDFQTLL